MASAWDQKYLPMRKPAVLLLRHSGKKKPFKQSQQLIKFIFEVLRSYLNPWTCMPLFYRRRNSSAAMRNGPIAHWILISSAITLHVLSHVSLTSTQLTSDILGSSFNVLAVPYTSSSIFFPVIWHCIHFFLCANNSCLCWNIFVNVWVFHVSCLMFSMAWLVALRSHRSHESRNKTMVEKERVSTSWYWDAAKVDSITADHLDNDHHNPCCVIAPLHASIEQDFWLLIPNNVSAV